MGKIADRVRTILQKFYQETEPTSHEEREEALVPDLATAGGLWRAVEDRTKVEKGRLARYKDAETMDQEDAVLQSVLDLYADNALHSSEGEEVMIEVETETPKVKEAVEGLMNRLNLQDLLWGLTRDVVKYGDDFEEHVVNARNEIVDLFCLDRTKTRREEQKREAKFIQANESGKTIAEFTEHELTHFRLTKSRGVLYGSSVLDPVRKVYKQIAMMEDGMVVRRLSRAAMRYGFMIPTGKLAPDDARAHVEKIKNSIKKRRLLDSNGRLTQRDAPMYQDEDYFIPVPEGEHGDVKVLQGDSALGNIGDVQYFLNRLFSGVKVPKAWLGFEADVNAKATLTEQAISFARAARRVQKAILVGLTHICDVQFVLQGIDPTSAQYRLLLPAMSTVDEMRTWELEQLKAQVAKIYGVDLKVLPTEYILTHFVGLSPEEAQELVAKKAEEDQLATEAEMMAQAALNPPQPATEQLWAKMQLKTLIESTRELSMWSLEHRAWERMRDPAERKTVLYLGD